jgi:hypothetical protein
LGDAKTQTRTPIGIGRRAVIWRLANSLEKWDVAIVKGKLARKYAPQTFSLFLAPTRSINHARISEIRDGAKHKAINAELDAFLRASIAWKLGTVGRLGDDAFEHVAARRLAESLAAAGFVFAVCNSDRRFLEYCASRSLRSRSGWRAMCRR